MSELVKRIGGPVLVLSILKHKVAKIEGVVDIKISAAFLARSSRTERDVAFIPEQV
jgi:hypothetical protein